MPSWTELFDNHGVKTVSKTDKMRRAYVPTADQRLAMKAAGLEPSSGDHKAIHVIGVLFDSSLRSMQISYYNSERVGSHRNRTPETRIGQGLPRWISAGDQIVIGNVGKRVFVAKEPLPPLGRNFLTSDNGDHLTTQDSEPLTVPVEPDLDDLSRRLEAGIPVLIGTPVELRRRREIRSRIDELQNELSRLSSEYGGMGHNNPPKDEDLTSADTEVLSIMVNSSNILTAELSKEEPNALEIAKAGSSLRNLGHWLAGKGDVFADEFAKGLGKSLGENIGKAIGLAVLITTISSVIGFWLQAITWPF